MSVGKGFMGGFGGCLGVGCAVVVVLIAIPVGCLMIGGVAVHNAQQKGHELAEQAKSASPSTSPSTPANETTRPKVVNRLTAENFSRIENGMTYAQVKRIIGPASEETASASSGMDTEFATKIVMLTWKGSWAQNGTSPSRTAGSRPRHNLACPTVKRQKTYLTKRLNKRRRKRQHRRKNTARPRRGPPRRGRQPPSERPNVRRLSRKPSGTPGPVPMGSTRSRRSS